MTPRVPLTVDRVLQAALQVADNGGAGALTIRNVATSLGVKPMALYHHVENKDAILDGVVDLVFGEMLRPELGDKWREQIEQRCRSKRTVLARHPWAITLINSRRSPGPNTLAQHDSMIGVLRQAGFSWANISHGIALIDAYVLGFATQETSIPAAGTAELHDLAGSVLENMPVDDYPHFVAFASEWVMQPGYDFAHEFEIGLGIVLDGVERLFVNQVADS